MKIFNPLVSEAIANELYFLEYTRMIIGTQSIPGYISCYLPFSGFMMSLHQCRCFSETTTLQFVSHYETRMHSSRMRTARTLTVLPCSLLFLGGGRREGKEGREGVVTRSDQGGDLV